MVIMQPNNIYIIAETSTGEIAFAKANNASISYKTDFYEPVEQELVCQFNKIQLLNVDKKIFGFNPDEILELIHEQENVNEQDYHPA